MEKENLTMPRIMYSCYTQLNRDGENYIADHVLSYLVSGTQEIFVNDRHFTFHEGEIRFFSKNQLASFAKIPSSESGEFSAVTVRIDRNALMYLSAEYGLKVVEKYQGELVRSLEPTLLLRKFFHSLEPYYDRAANASNLLVNMKVREAVLILIEAEPELKNLLFDFREPGKIDLENFMLKNYRFNAHLGKFAYLTGRSLATFKRDFQKVFSMSPHAWIMKKRLSDAYDLLKEKKLSVSETFIQVGFKDLAHFSFAFKRHFGFPPSKIFSSESEKSL